MSGNIFFWKKMYSQFCQNLERTKLFLQTFSFWPKWSNTILRANTKNQRNINVVQVLKNLIHEYQINVHSYVMKLANITQGYWNTKINYLIFNEMNMNLARMLILENPKIDPTFWHLALASEISPDDDLDFI